MLPAAIRPLLALLTALVALLPAALANVEKTVFVAPSAVAVPNVRPGLQDLRLASLSPFAHVLRAHLPVAFPSDDSPRGFDSWYLLTELAPGQRYEVRVCWAATQPTSFWLDAHPITHVFDTPELITSLASFSENIPEANLIVDDRRATEAAETSTSLLFLRIQAAADFYSLNKTRMSSPPDVKVDIILDPYILNAVPRSLIPTGVYIIALAVGAWFLSSFIVNWASAIESIKPHTD
ncbi:uncharacterized protein BKCO1_4300029 [Diplodia corticola]|uniref:Uncharacterized protein n=1 Tax=Diplodia corticola TaxID=236234 RepID=A0A1J9RU02_9PEZI|nr:uncharacterized protein BKCO1_4300029 [Diplodia corticola]OJD31903.1 hypothetical protein BKCO1_4300029 [Diplodia corticola]